ncbi:MAG: hypothetical protein EB078_00605 [Proteobacteria bacterium]|nr:hypothetical protein [Pseudomonadota bacterium]
MRSVSLLALVVLLSSCGIVHYPGQPGMVPSTFSKLDLEVLEEPGLFVYESVYDNTSSGQGVTAVITKLYPKAQTYTTNVRTNADGTLFRVKAQYNGADIQMISMPQQNQIYVNPGHQLMFLVDCENSVDEIDEKNIAEENLFKPSNFLQLSQKAFETKRLKWEIIKAARFLPSGNLGYEITSLQMNQAKFVPTTPVTLETTLNQNAIKTTLSTETKGEFVSFLESNFPKGYRGKVDFFVKDSVVPLTFNLGVNTFKTAEASGLKIIRGIPEALIKDILGKSSSDKK